MFNQLQGVVFCIEMLLTRGQNFSLFSFQCCLQYQFKRGFNFLNFNCHGNATLLCSYCDVTDDEISLPNVSQTCLKVLTCTLNIHCYYHRAREIVLGIFGLVDEPAKTVRNCFATLTTFT